MAVWVSKTAVRLGETLTISWNYAATGVSIRADDSTTAFDQIRYSYTPAESARSCTISINESGFVSGNVFNDTVDSVRTCTVYVNPADVMQTDYEWNAKITITIPAVRNDLAVVDVASTEDRLINKSWVNVGDSIGIYSTCAADFTRELFYKQEDDTNYISLGKNPGAIKIWAVPKQLASKYPSQKSIKCTVFQNVRWREEPCRSMANQKVLIVYVPNCEETSPKNVTATKTLTHSLPSKFDGVPIQGITNIWVNITAESDYSEIDHCSISGYGVYDEAYYWDEFGADPISILNAAGEIKITCTATDKRGYSSSVVLTQPVVEYAGPKILPAAGRSKVICERCNQTGDVIDDGTHLRILARRSCSPVEWNGAALNDCEMQYRVEGGAWQTILEKEAEGDTVDLILAGVVDDIYRSYAVDLRVVDGIGKEKILSFIVSSALVDFHLWNGKAAFFKYAELDRTVDVNGDLIVRENMILPGGTVQDYIVELGTVGNWNWRKWASGAAECWGANKTGIETVTVASITVSAKAYPPGLFADAPVEHFMLYSPDCDTVTIQIKSKNTKDLTAAYMVAVVNVESTETVKTVRTETYYRAIGRWK